MDKPVVHVVSMRQFLFALWRTRLIYRRRQLRMTQETLAEVSGYSLSAVKHWEWGTKVPQAQSLKDWQEALS